MSQYHTINAGETERFFTVVARASGNPITSSTVNYYLKAMSGGNAGKWWKDSTQSWAATEQANAMTHEADGHWEIDLTSTPFEHGVRYLEYVKETSNLHVPDSRHLVCRAAPGVTGGVAAQDTVNAIQTATGSIYHAVIDFNLDTAGLKDRYGVRWYKNAVRKTTGVTDAKIQVIKLSDVTALIAQTAMNDRGSNTFEYEASGSERIDRGTELYEVIVTATIDAATRTWSTFVGRDTASS